MIGNEAAHALADALLQNNTISELCLSSNHIGNAGAQAMADMLLTNLTIESIMLGGNGFGEKLKHEIQENIMARRTAQHNVNEQHIRMMDERYEQHREAERLLQAIKQGQIASVQIALPQLGGFVRKPLSSPNGMYPRPSMRDQLDAALMNMGYVCVTITISLYLIYDQATPSWHGNDRDLRKSQSTSQLFLKRDWFHSVDPLDGIRPVCIHIIFYHCCD